MPIDSAEILRQALTLPPDDRAKLAGSLIASLDTECDADAPEAWSVEVERRLEELDGGAVVSVPWPEVRQRLIRRRDGV